MPSFGYQRGSQSTVYTDPTKPPEQSTVCPPGKELLLGVCVPVAEKPPELDPSPTQPAAGVTVRTSGTYTRATHLDDLPGPVDQPFPWGALIAGLAGVFFLKS
jgi:hypothetical protein